MEEDEFEAALRIEFLTEASELLDECESAFLELEKGSQSSETIDSIFRVAHTLKGGALTVGLSDFGGFAHTFENLLMKIRNGEITPDSETIDVLLGGNDKLREFAENPDSDVDASEIVAKIKGVAAAQGRDNAPKVAEGTAKEESTATGGFFDATAVPEVPSPGAEKTSGTDVATAGKTYSNAVPTVLICDDNADILELLEEMISDLDVMVVTAPDPIVALEILANQKIDTIYTDLNMPKMSGIEFIEKVRETDPSLPVIFCSGFAGRDEIARFMELGAYAFIDKPIERENVEIQIKNALKLKRLNDGIKLLSGLNFNAYLSMTKLIKHFDDGNLDGAKEIRSKLEGKLDEISSLTNSLLRHNG